MSDANKVGVEFAGGVDPSYDSSVDHVKKGLRETATEYGKATAEIVTHTAKAYAEHTVLHKILHTLVDRYKEYKVAAGAAAAAGGEVGASNGILSASFGVVRFAAARALAPIAPAAAGAISAFGLVYGAVKVVNGALWVLEKASGTAMEGLSKFAVLEDMAGKLRRVSSSAADARAKVGDLAATFRGTPVSVPAAVDAYRSAKVADNGSGELSDRKGLTMLGDVAAASGNGIAETTSAVGALYVALQSGQPIGQAADQLRSMGVISAETRRSLDTLLASGKSGPEVWGALRTSLESSSGAMKEQQQTLSGLQKAVQDAKDQLYTSFARGSVDYEKDKLTAQATILQKLNPVAEEAGDVYGGVKSSLAGLVKWLLEATGAKAAQDKAMESTAGLKRFTDGVIIAGVALTAFLAIAAAAAVGFAIFTTFTVGIGPALTGMVAFGLAVAAIPALVLAAGAAVAIYVFHLKALTEAQLAYANSTQEMINGLDKEIDAMTTAADRAKALADAYAIAKKAREEYNDTTKTPEERQAAKVRADAAAARIAAVESYAGDLVRMRAKVREKINAAGSETERGPLLIQEGKLTERINRGERATAADYSLEGEDKQRTRSGPEIEEGLAGAQKRAEDRQAAALRSLDAAEESKDAAQIGAAQAELATATEAATQAKQAAQDARDHHANLKQAAEDADANARTQRQKTGELDDHAYATEQAAGPDAVAELRAQSNDLRRRADETEKKLLLKGRDTTNDNQTVEDAQQEEARLRESRAQDLAKADEIDQRRAGLSQLAVQARQNAVAQRDVANKATADAATAHQTFDDKEKEGGENRQKQKDEDDKKKADEDKKAREQTVGEAEAEAEANIAAIQTEGIQRAREEYEINRQLLEVKLQQAEAEGDSVKLAKLRADYYRDQQAMARKEDENKRAVAEDSDSYIEAVAKRQEDADKREIERKFKAGTITDDQRRELEAGILQRQQARANNKADEKDKEADDTKGDEGKALRLRREAENLRAQADAIGAERDNLLNPEQQQQRQNAVADNLQRVGGGGNVYYGGNGKSPLEAKMDRQIKAGEDAVSILRRLEDKRGGSAFQ